MRTACLLALVFSSLSASADVVSSAPDSVRVVIYRDETSDEDYDSFDGDLTTGLAMVTETRSLDLPAGESKLVLRGVADAIVPQTAVIEGLPGVVLESNYDYDLLTPGAIIARAEGQRVRVIHTNPATGHVTERNAIVRSGPEGVMLEVDGRLEALGCSGLAEKLIFERMPAGLADEPTLSMRIRVPDAGRYSIALSYLSLGLDWSADYIARIDPGGQTLDLEGWITLVNRSSTTFADAPTEVVAGTLSRDREETQPPEVTAVVQRANCWPIGSFATRGRARRISAEAFSPVSRGRYDLQEIIVTGQSRLDAQVSELGDYKLYTLPIPTTVAARQSKQVRFLSQTNVRYERVYVYTLDEADIDDPGESSGVRPQVLLRLQNKKRAGLGKPLPAGTVRVFESLAPTGAALAGEDALQDSPVGVPVEIDLGPAMDVWVEPTIVRDDSIEHDEYDEREAEIEVRIGNDKPVAAVVEYRHPGDLESFRIVRESRRHTMKNGHPQWTLKLKPGAREVLRYTLRHVD